MSWWGTVIGGSLGFWLGGPLGAMLGAVIGNSVQASGSITASFDPGAQQRVQTAFFTATFSVMGHLAKADGVVTHDEIAHARAVMRHMDLSPEMEKTAIRLFNEGKAADFPLDDIVDQFRRECHRRINLIRMFIEIQLQAVYVDGEMHPGERASLLRICERLGLSEAAFNNLDAMFRGAHVDQQRGAARSGSRQSISAAYAILGIDKSASDAEVKKSYRRLMNQHHPDKLVAKGLPEEMMKIATEKTHEIRTAYEQVKESRGL